MEPISSRTGSRMIPTALALLAGTCSLAVEPPSIPPSELVKRTVANEMKIDDRTVKFLFRERKQTPNGSQTRLMVETRDAMAAMVVAINDRPLSQEQRQDEYGRMQHFINDPEELDRKRKKEREDTERVQRILRALPDAFLYEYDGTEIGKPGVGKTGEELLRLKFHPNPKYEPPSRVEQVLTVMQGILLIDVKEQHIAKIEGNLAKDVGFGWGILGRLDRGGRFLVEQADITDNNWAITRMELAMTGKVLLFKSLNINSTEVFSDFHPVPANLTFAQGVQLLKEQKTTVTENQAENGGGK